MEILRGVFGGFSRSLRRCYSQGSIEWQLTAAALTYLLVVSGFDWWWFAHTRAPALQVWLFPAAIIGGLLPIILPIALYVIGKMKKRVALMTAGFATAQAGILGLLVSMAYKSVTGRLHPPFNVPLPVDTSHAFQFGFFERGAFWGWPSSHTTVAFAMAVTIFVLYWQSRSATEHEGGAARRAAWGALLVALYIGLGVSTNIHWFSDFVAGAIIGTLIGLAVGKSFNKEKLLHS